MNCTTEELKAWLAEERERIIQSRALLGLPDHCQYLHGCTSDIVTRIATALGIELDRRTGSFNYGGNAHPYEYVVVAVRDADNRAWFFADSDHAEFRKVSQALIRREAEMQDAAQFNRRKCA